MKFSPAIKPGSVYIHWPFCPYKCNFCPFVALAGHEQYMERYHNALIAEIKAYGRQLSVKPTLETIFIGGGTPSTYPPHLLLDMLGTLKSVCSYNALTEITIEVNPGTVDSTKLLAWQQAGINRLSIGVQSLNDTVLKKLNRHQTSADVLSLITQASTMFDVLSIDLILGLPGISHDEWKQLINTIVQWPIKHCSVYFLTVHENTPLYFAVKQHKILLDSDDGMVDLYDWTVAKLREHGFMQYELSNFARDAFECKHNRVYWEHKPYKAFGLGACSFDGTSRFQNTKNLLNYLQFCEQEQDPNDFFEQLTHEQLLLEARMLQLRQAKGVQIQALMESLSLSRQAELMQTIALLCREQYLTQEQDRIALTVKGFAVANEITLKLCINE